MRGALQGQGQPAALAGHSRTFERRAGTSLGYRPVRYPRSHGGCREVARLLPLGVVRGPMNHECLILSLPHDMCTATSLGLEGFARHRSPGSGSVFQGRAIFVDLAVANGKPDFRFRDEGGWRDATGDTEKALAECQTKRTKTALSNSAFNIVPMEAFKSVSLVRTGGHVLALEPAGERLRFPAHAWHLDMSPDDVAATLGLAERTHRAPRAYMVLAPSELVILSSLTPEEYAWYATHRAGKLFRQVMFTEIDLNPRHLVAEQSFEQARDDLERNPKKKTKTIYHGGAYDKVPFTAWTGNEAHDKDALYCADRERLLAWRFPAKVPTAWIRAEG